MKECSRCIMSEKYPGITFDESGVCSKCREQDRRYLNKDYAALGQDLQRIVEWAKSRKKRYDCVVPFSGGKDSSYTLYLCRRKFGMKVLAVNFNNGLRTVAALKNMEKIVQKTDSGYVCYGPGWETMKKLYRAFFLKTGQFCFPCDMGIWATVQRVAEQYDVPLIVSGFSAQIESRGAQIYSYNNTLFRRIAGGILSDQEMKDFLGQTSLDKVLRRLKHFTLTRYRRQISLPEYMAWDDKEIKDTISRELEWEKREDGSSDHIDCLFAPMKNYLVVQKWGFGEKTTKYSAMVRAGQMARDEAVSRAREEESKDVSSDIRRFMSTLGITEEDVVAAKRKDHLVFLK